MDWYKKAQLETIDRTDGSIDDYRAIGHDLYHRNQKARIDNPNYLWVYRNGMIEANPETMEQSSHSFYPQWNNVEYDKTYAGRYSPSTKTITIIRPIGVFEFREIPSHLKRLLQQQFPEAQKLSIHASARSWYKKAQQLKEDQWQWDEETMWNYYETHDETMMEQVRDFNESKPGDRQTWRLIPLPRVKKIWADYMRMGFVRDTRGIQLIEDIIIENVRKIHANTIMMGHTTQDPEVMLQENEMTMNETDEHDYGDWATDDKGAWRISDYALGKLVNGTLELMHAKTPEDKLQKIDFILNVVHQRSDIATWFVQGGIEGLDELSNQVI